MALLQPLTTEDLQTFLRDGVLVKHILSEEELSSAMAGLKQTLIQHNVDTDNLIATGQNLRHLSSTNGSGGVLDLFYDDWKIQLVATNATLFAATVQLWDAAFCHSNEKKENLATEKQFMWHPYGAFDCHKGYIYMDRIGYRLPTKLAKELGAKIAAANNDNSDKATVRKAKRVQPIQRSLTPHLDCCPQDFFTKDARKWRPIQCFVALTDTLEPNTGGFEAAKGFHREFESWTAKRAPSTTTRKQRQRATQDSPLEFPAPCIGDYTHIRPVEDRDVIERVQHIPVPAGSAVFWDNRIPHSNSYLHNGDKPRAVVYCSFLPDVHINRQYCANQLEDWKAGRNPTDQWIRVYSSNDNNPAEAEVENQDQYVANGVSIHVSQGAPLARRLAGIEPWR